MNKGKMILRSVSAALILMTLLSAFSLFPSFAAVKKVTLNALYGKIENYSTVYGLRTYFIVGFSDYADELTKAVALDSYRFVFTVKDENDGSSSTFEYHSRNSAEVYDTDGLDFVRIPVCEYGVIPDPAHAYTLTFDAYDGSGRIYTGGSAAGAFVSGNEDFLSHGPVVPDLMGLTADPSSVLYGKKILFAGDSITEAICEVNVPEKAFVAGWPGRIAAANGAYCMNLGRSGATVSNNRGSNQVLMQLKSVEGRSFDLVILHGGVNDAWFLAPIGSVTADDVRAEGSFDESTFAGGLEETFRYAKQTFPDAKIGYVINHTMPMCKEGNTSDMHDLFEVAKTVCDKWDVPYLDLYNNTELNDVRMRTSTLFTLGDNYRAHPNDRGYDILFPYIDQFAKAVYLEEDVSALTDPPFSAPAEYTVTGETNVARGKPAKNSSGTSIPVVTDGKVDAYASLGNWADTNRGPAYGTDGDCFLEIDLGAAYDLDKINVVNYLSNILYKWDAYVTLDNTKEIRLWTKVGGKTSNELSYEDGYTISFAPVTARYLRVYGMGHTGTAYVVNEVSAYGTFNEAETLGDAELIKAEIASAVTSEGEDAGKLTDGVKDADPAVIPAPEGGQVTADLGAVKALSSVAVYTYENNSSYTLLGSNDGATFTKIGKKEKGEATYTAANGHEFIFAVSSSYRYLRVQWEESERADGYVALAEIIAYDASGNEIQIADASAENVSGSAGSAKDGSKTTYVFICRPNGGFVLDLGEKKNLRKVSVWPVDPAVSFTVSVSTNGNVYSSFATYLPDGSGAPISLFGEAGARYVKISPAEDAETDSFGLYEVELFYEEEQLDPDDPTLTLPNAALGKPAVLYTKQKKTDEDYVLISAPKLTDGKYDDVWAYGAFGEMYAEVDLETVYELSAVNLRAYYSSNYNPFSHAWSVYLSEDGETYALAASVPKTGHPEEGITVTFGKTNARYVRVVADYYVTSEQFSFREVSVYGKVPEVPLGETPIASVTQNGGRIDALTDGDLYNEQHFTDASGGYVDIDLKSEKQIDRIAVYTYENNSSYTVFGSANGSAWTVLGTKAIDELIVADHYTADKGWEKTFALSGSYRYVRVQWAASSRSDGYLTIREIDVLCGGEEYTDVTLANHSIIYANNNSDDGNYGNHTYYKKAPSSILVDLGKEQDVRRAEFYFGSFTAFRVERSADGETFYDFGTVFDAEDGKATLTIDYSNTRYLRLTGLCGDTLNLSEIKVYTPYKGLPGDLNADGIVSIDDVSALLDCLATGTNPEAGPEAADLDASGDLDIRDAAALLDLLAAATV